MSLTADIVQQAERLGRRVQETAAAGLARLVLDEERNFRLVAAGRPEGLDQVLPGHGIVVLEGELVAVAERAAGDLVGADGLGKVLGLLDEAHGLVADLFVKRGQPAVSELGLGLDVHVDGGDLQLVFFQHRLGLSRVVDLVRVDDLHPVETVHLGHELELAVQIERLVVLVEPVLGLGQEPGDDGHFEHACLLLMTSGSPISDEIFK